jgi:uncharacterized RDD family membrane protein YckC
MTATRPSQVATGQRPPGPSLLVSTKLRPPRLREGLVERHLLVERLREGRARTLTLVSAPEALASETETARARGRKRLEAVATEVLDSPEVERTVDHTLAGPLTDGVARSLAEHRVTQRVAAEVLASPQFEQAFADALDHETTRRLTEQVVRSSEFQQAIEVAASSPAVRTALAHQTTTLTEELAENVRESTATADESAERRVRRWFRRPARVVEEGFATPPYSGIATRAVALALDGLLALTVAVVVGGALALIASLVSELRPEWLVAVVTACWWSLVTASYFVFFWTAAGQTPGMRVMRIRVLTRDGGRIGLGRSIVRVVGLALAIIPCFAGFIPVLFDERRRGLPDYLAGTSVYRVDRAPPPAPSR